MEAPESNFEHEKQQEAVEQGDGLNVLIKQLGSDDFQKREEAQQMILTTIAASDPVQMKEWIGDLQKQQEVGDAEVAARVEQILQYREVLAVASLNSKYKAQLAPDVTGAAIQHEGEDPQSKELQKLYNEHGQQFLDDLSIAVTVGGLSADRFYPAYAMLTESSATRAETLSTMYDQLTTQIGKTNGVVMQAALANVMHHPHLDRETQLRAYEENRLLMRDELSLNPSVDPDLLHKITVAATQVEAVGFFSPLQAAANNPQLKVETIDVLLDVGDAHVDSLLCLHDHLTEAQADKLIAKKKSHAREIMKNNAISVEYLEKVWNGMSFSAKMDVLESENTSEYILLNGFHDEYKGGMPSDAMLAREALSKNSSTPDSVFEQIVSEATEDELDIVVNVAGNPGANVELLRELASHSSPDVRAAAAGNANIALDALDRLRNDENEKVRTEAEANPL